MTLQVRLLLSPLYSSAPLSRVEHCHSNRRRLPLVGHQEGVGGIVVIREAMIEKSHAARPCYRAPCTCHGDFFKTCETREIHLRLGYRPGRAEPLVVSPELLHPHHALRQELLPFFSA